jgi:hypothetical protein
VCGGGKPFDNTDHDDVNLGKEWMCGHCVSERVDIVNLYKMNKGS